MYETKNGEIKIICHPRNSVSMATAAIHPSQYIDATANLVTLESE